jgi:hypothetical protein
MFLKRRIKIGNVNAKTFTPVLQNKLLCTSIVRQENLLVLGTQLDSTTRIKLSLKLLLGTNTLA